MSVESVVIGRTNSSTVWTRLIAIPEVRSQMLHIPRRDSSISQQGLHSFVLNHRLCLCHPILAAWPRHVQCLNGAPGWKKFLAFLLVQNDFGLRICEPCSRLMACFWRLAQRQKGAWCSSKVANCLLVVSILQALWNVPSERILTDDDAACLERYC